MLVLMVGFGVGLRVGFGRGEEERRWDDEVEVEKVSQRRRVVVVVLFFGVVVVVVLGRSSLKVTVAIVIVWMYQ